MIKPCNIHNSIKSYFFIANYEFIKCDLYAPINGICERERALIYTDDMSIIGKYPNVSIRSISKSPIELYRQKPN